MSDQTKSGEKTGLKINSSQRYHYVGELKQLEPDILISEERFDTK